MTVTLSPSAPGQITGRLTVLSNDSDEETLYVSLEGDGVASEINIFETSHDFGGVVVGNSSDWTLTVHNIGPVDLIVTEIVSTDPNFLVASPDDFPQSVPPGGRLDVVVTFAPTSGGVKTGNLIIRSDDPDEAILYVSLLGTGLSADIGLSATTLDFGEVMTESSSSLGLIIYNWGTLDLVVSQAIIAPSAFAVVSPSFPQTVEPAGSLAAEISFSPVTVGVIDGSLTLRSNDPDESEVTIALTGRGIPRSPNILLSAVSHDFGDVLIDTSATWEFQIFNTGLANLRVGSVLPDRAEFSVLGPTFPQEIAPDESLTVSVAFTPTSAGVRAGVLRVRSDDPDEGVLTVSLSGRGVAPQIEVSARSSDFGPVLLGNSAVWSLTLSNQGTADLTVEAITSSHPNFSVADPTFPRIIPPGSSVIQSVLFTPSSLGLITGTLTVSSNDPGEPVLLISVSGMGVKPDIHLSAQSHDFGEVHLGSSGPWELVIQNLGTAPLTVKGVFSNHPAFTVPAPSFPQTVEPGAVLSVTVLFAPTSLGEVTGNLTVVSNDPENETLVLLLRGTGAPPPAPQILLSENGHDFELIEVGASAQWRLTVYNWGDLELIVSRASSDNPDFQIVDPTTFPQRIDPSSHVHLTIDFTPSEAGTRTGQITLDSNDPERGTVIITVTGYGSAPEIELSSLSHDYGRVLLLNPQPWTMTIVNQGTKDLAVTELTSDREEFAVTSPAFPQTVDPGSSLDVTVTFLPLTEGEIMGTLSIRSNDPNEALLSVQLTGVGAASKIHLSEAEHNFGTAAVGDSSMWTVIVTNLGDEDLVIDRVDSGHPDFVTVSPPFPREVKKYCGIEILIAFVPSSEGRKEGSLTIINNDSYQPCSPLRVQGTGIAPDIDPSALSHNYGEVLLGQSRGWTLALSNLGAVDLVVDSIVSDVNDFSVESPSFPQVIEPGGRIDVVALFSPAELGDRDGQLVVYSNDYDEGAVEIDLSGRGVSPQIELSETSHDFGQIWVGDSTSWTFTITNQGDYDLIISDVRCDLPDFVLVTPAFPQKIYPECSLDVTVSFAPKSVGAKLCSLVVETNHPVVDVVTLLLEGEGVLPQIGASALDHDFGALAVGDAAEWILTLSNRGTAPLTIDGIELTNSVDFGIAEYVFPIIIDPQGSLDIPVAFHPPNSTHKEGQLIITSNDPNNPVLTIGLRGKGLARDILLSDRSHDFGSVVVGARSDWTFTITNLGELSLEITEVVSSHSDFMVAAPVFPYTLQNGASVEVRVAFVPSSVGVRVGSLEVRSNDPDEGVLTLALAGVGVAPELELSSYSYDFGDVVAGACAAWDLMVHNRGTYDLELLSVTTDHVDFRASMPGLPLIVAPGDSQEVELTFCPSAPGAASGRLSVCVDGAVDECVDVPLRGRGVLQDIALSAEGYDYGLVRVGGTSNWAFIVSNGGTAELTVHDVVSDRAEFVVASPVLPQHIEPGDSLGVVVAFTPSVLGAVSGALTVRSDDPDEEEVTITLQGEGALPDIELSATDHNFGLVVVGQSSEWTLVLSNLGKLDLVVADIVSDNSEFVPTTSELPSTIGPGAQLMVEVSFVPSSAGTKSGGLTVRSDDPDEEVLTVTLTGKGVDANILLSETFYDFGSVVVGGSAEWVFAVTNIGGQSVRLSQVRSTHPDFVVTAPVFPLTLGPGQSEDVAVSYRPSSVGASVGTLMIVSDDPDEGVLQVMLQGFGASPEVEFSSYSHDFGRILVGDCGEWPLTISNTGTSDLEITNVRISHPDFTVPELYFIIVPLIIAPGESVEWTVRFCPSAPGGAECSLEVCVDGVIDQCTSLLLTGTGILQDVAFSATSHNYGPVRVGGTSNWALMIMNTGTADLTVFNVTSDRSEFEITTPTFPQTVSPGASIGVVVAFTPSELGSVSATLTVTSNDPDEESVTIPVQGEGVLPGLHISATAHDFGTLTAGDSSVWGFTLSNTGNARLIVTQVVSDNTDFIVSGPTFPRIMEPGDSLDVTVIFAPITSGDNSGTVTVTTDDPEAPVVAVTLRGRAVVTDVELSAERHDYGKVLVGSSSDWTLVLSNRGRSEMTILSITSDMPEFVVVSQEFPITMPPGGSIDVGVMFVPSAVGRFIGILTIEIADFGADLPTIQLTGEGVLPDIELSAPSHDYGDVVVGDSSLWRLTISNLGTADLVVYGVVSYRPEFSVLSPSFPQVVAPAGSIEVTVAFVPASGEEIAGRLSVESNDPDEPLLAVDMTGRGIAGDLYIPIDHHDYGDVVVSDSALWVLPLHNIGRGPLTIHQVVTDDIDFLVAGPTFPQTIEPGQSLAVSIHFVPSALGSVEATVTVTSNDLFEPNVDLTLRGNGLPVPLLKVVDGFGDPGSGGNKVFIDLQNPLQIAGVQLGLTYDSNLLTITDVQLAERTRHMGIFNIGFPHAGQIVILIQDLSGGVIPSGSGPIVELTLQVSAEAPMEGLDLNLVGVILYDAVGSPVPVTTEDGIFTVTVPDIAVEVWGHDYGHVSVGRSADWPLIIRNPGTKELIISQVLTDKTDFQAAAPTFPCTVAVAESAVVVITFAPSAVGPISASATIESNDPDEGALALSLSGVGIKPDICIAEIIHDFGEVVVDSSATWAAPMANLGVGELVVDSIFTVGSDFSVEEIGYPLVLAERESVFVAVSFTPSSAQAVRGSLVVLSNDPDEERFVLPLWGRGIAPDIDLSPTSYNFGEVDVGEVAETDFMVYNRGRVELALDSVKAQPSPFSVLRPDFPQTVAPGGSLTVTASFAPTSLGDVVGSLTVFSSDPDEGQLSVALRGRGVGPDIWLSASSYIFGRVKLGQSEEWEFSVSNLGTRDLVVESILSDTSDFVVTSPSFPLTLAPREDVTVLITFQPSAVGMISGRLTVLSNDPDEAALYITLLGHGAEPDIELSATSLDFGRVALRSSAERRLAVRNVGGADLVISTVSSSRADFVVSEIILPAIVPKRDSLEVTVTFIPSAVGAVRGSLLVASDDSDEPVLYVELAGEGFPAAILTVGSGHGTPGSDDNPVFIYLSNTVPVATVRFFLNFDPDRLSISNVQTTSRIAHMGSFDWDVVSAGELLVLISDFGNKVIEPGTGSILRVGFSVAPDADFGTVPLTLVAVAFYDNDENEIFPGTRDGFFTVGPSYVYNFGDVPVGEPASITLNCPLPNGRDGDWVIGGIGCDNPDFTIVSPPGPYPLVVSSQSRGVDVTIVFTPSQIGEEWGLIALNIIAPQEETVLLPVVGRGAVASMESWTVDLTCLSSNTSLPDSLRAKNLTFGVDPAGTDNFDSGLDMALPPMPPVIKFEVYFPETTLVGRLSKDVRSSASSNLEWTIETKGTGGTISWDRDELPEGDFMLNRTVDMKSISQASFSKDETLTIQYSKTQTAVQLSHLSVQFGDGWATVLWETAYEEKIAGFNVYRLVQAGLRPTVEHRLNSTLITGSHSYSFVDKTATPGEIYYYWIEAVGFDGATSFLGSVSGRVSVPRSCVLSQNYPNPFNPETHIDYIVNGRENVSLVIYNSLGQRVRVLVEGPQVPGTYTVTWDGRDDDGNLVPSGMYLYRITIGPTSETKKMVMLK
ncbi:MAG: choice-of-anchor D domain-containing protein [bacterium]